MAMMSRDLVFYFLDCLISNLFIAPLVVFYWRGTWELLDFYLLPDSVEYSAWISLTLGIFVIVTFNLLQRSLSTFSVRLSTTCFFLFSRLYTYILGLAIVNHWRGVWLLLNAYTGVNCLSAVLSVLTGSGLLFAFRSYRNVLSPPVVLATDIFPADHCQIPTRFKQEKTCLLFVLDVLFTVIFNGSLIVVVWRGYWELMNIYVFPDNAIQSACFSLNIAYGLVSLLLITTAPMKIISRKLEEKAFIAKVIFEDFLFFLKSLVAICHWRGFWIFLDELVFPSNQELSRWLTHSVGTVVLVVMCSFNSVLARGCVLDGWEGDGEGVTMDISYTTAISEMFRCKHSITEVSHERSTETRDSQGKSGGSSSSCSSSSSRCDETK